MSDLPSDPDPGVPPEYVSAPTPRWVKVFGLIALVVIVLFVVLLLTGRGDHGPGRHAFEAPPNATDHGA